MDEKERIYHAVMLKLVESGEKERLKQSLKSKLLSNGFHDQLTEQAKELIRKRGQERIPVEDLIVDLLPHARGIYSFLFFFCPIS